MRSTWARGPSTARESTSLLTAQTLARLRGDADRAVIVAQQHGTVGARYRLGDVALLAANRCKHPHPALQRAIASRTNSLAVGAELENSLEPCRRNNDLLSQPLHVSLHGLGVAQDRTHHHLMHTSVTVTFHLV